MSGTLPVLCTIPCHLCPWVTLAWLLSALASDSPAHATVAVIHGQVQYGRGLELAPSPLTLLASRWDNWKRSSCPGAPLHHQAVGLQRLTLAWLFLRSLPTSWWEHVSSPPFPLLDPLRLPLPCSERQMSAESEEIRHFSMIKM